MTPRPTTINVGASIRTAMRMLQELDVRHLPVVADGSLAGIVSDRDLREVTSRLLAEGAPDTSEFLDAPVSNLMSSDVLSVDPETELDDVIDLMIEHRIGALPVVDPRSGGVVGMVSYVDVLRNAKESS